MYNATGGEVVGQCTECAINLLQFIVSAREVSREDRVGQVADTRWESVVYTLSEAFPVNQNLYDLNLPTLESK